MSSGGVADVTAFLSSIGLEQCVQAVVHNGFYTSMEALRGATYEELVDSGVRPVHAKLILSNLGSAGLGSLPPLASDARADEAGAGVEEVASFLRSVGLEMCVQPLADAGYTSLELLGRATLQDLLGAGIKPVHARLIVSNLDSANSSGINMTPHANRVASLDEETLLGGPRKRRSHTKLYLGGALLLLFIVLMLALSGAFSAPAAAPPVESAPRVGKGLHKLKGDGSHKGKGGHSKDKGVSNSVAPAAAPAK